MRYEHGPLVTFDKAERWLRDAEIGSKLTYFIGHLAETANYKTGASYATEAARLRDFFQLAATNEKVHLLQKRNAYNEYEYMAIRRRPNNVLNTHKRVRQLMQA